MINIFTKHGVVKVLGTAVCVSGAVLMVFYRGPSLIGTGGAADATALSVVIDHSHAYNYAPQWLAAAMLRNGVEAWHLGVVCLIGNCFLMGAYLVIQVTQTWCADCVAWQHWGWIYIY